MTLILSYSRAPQFALIFFLLSEYWHTHIGSVSFKKTHAKIALAGCATGHKKHAGQGKYDKIGNTKIKV